MVATVSGSLQLLVVEVTVPTQRARVTTKEQHNRLSLYQTLRCSPSFALLCGALFDFLRERSLDQLRMLAVKSSKMSATRAGLVVAAACALISLVYFAASGARLSLSL